MSKPTTIKPFALPTSKMAAYLGVSKDFLQKNKGSIFQQGTHYNRPIGSNRDMWIVSKMEEWTLGQQISNDAAKVLDAVCGG